MPDPDPNDDRRDDGGAPTGGIRIDIGLQPLTDLLGGLLDRAETSRSGDGPPSPVRSPSSWRPGRSLGTPERGARRDRSGESDAAADDESYLVDSHRDGDEMLVTADLPGVDAEDLSVGLDPEANLVVGVEGDVIERVPLPWDAVEATRARFHNHVLEVRLRPAGGA